MISKSILQENCKALKMIFYAKQIILLIKNLINNKEHSKDGKLQPIINTTSQKNIILF
jgi:hypothetical protein